MIMSKKKFDKLTIAQKRENKQLIKVHKEKKDLIKGFLIGLFLILLFCSMDEYNCFIKLYELLV